MAGSGTAAAGGPFFAVDQHRHDERLIALRDLEAWLETPMLVLSFLWLVLVVIELAYGELAAAAVFGTAIWIAFLAEFALRFALAPDKRDFVVGNWLTVIALLLPALRLFRAFAFLRVAQTARGARLLRIVGTANRGMNALRASLGRRGLGYVLSLTVLVTLLGAGGMLAFEPAHEVPGGFASYWDALWWTAMLVTTIGSQFWPHSLEGRILGFLLALYGLAVFGYITASLASFFVGRAAGRGGAEADIAGLREDIAALRSELLRSRPPTPERGDERPS